MELKKFIREVPDFPKPGILFRDITPLLSEPAAFNFALGSLEKQCAGIGPDAIVGIESRGFIFAGAIASRLNLPFVPVRKPGKLPAEKMSVEYTLEYGSGKLDIHKDALRPGQKVAIVDDLLATGGTALAAAKLVELLGAKVASFIFLVELKALGGEEKLSGYKTFSLLKF